MRKLKNCKGLIQKNYWITKNTTQKDIWTILIDTWRLRLSEHLKTRESWNILLVKCKRNDFTYCICSHDKLIRSGLVINLKEKTGKVQSKYVVTYVFDHAVVFLQLLFVTCYPFVLGFFHIHYVLMDYWIDLYTIYTLCIHRFYSDD